MTKALSMIPRERIDDFCRRWKIATMSMSRSNRNEQDPSVFVRFDPEAQWNLTDRLRMQRELQQLSGIAIQVLNRLTGRRGVRGGYGNVVYDA